MDIWMNAWAAWAVIAFAAPYLFHRFSPAAALNLLDAKESDAPRSAPGMALLLGARLAMVSIGLGFLFKIAATVAGWRSHSNYVPPVGDFSGVGGLLLTLAWWSVVIPLAEELLCRTLGLGQLRRLFPRVFGSETLSMAAFGAANALVFMALHETADPVMMAIRLLQGSIAVYAYYRGGFLASFAWHGALNGAYAMVDCLHHFAGAFGGLLALSLIMMASYRSLRSLVGPVRIGSVSLAPVRLRAPTPALAGG